VERIQLIIFRSPCFGYTPKKEPQGFFLKPCGDSAISFDGFGYRIGGTSELKAAVGIRTANTDRRTPTPTTVTTAMLQQATV